MMNERIKELARDAGLLVHNPDGVPTKLEKFARLIIEECHRAVLEVPVYYKDYRHQIEQATIEDCARAVLEHFEVSE